jgi:hypothetical protein
MIALRSNFSKGMKSDPRSFEPHLLLNVVRKFVPHGFLKNNFAAPAASELKNQSGFLRTGARYDIIGCPLQFCGHLIVLIRVYPPYYEVKCLGFRSRIGRK